MRRFRQYYAEAVEPRLFLLSQLRDVPRGLTAGLAVLNVVVGLLPVAFVVGTSVVIGRAPAAVAAGTGSPQWRLLVEAFVVATAFFFLQQVLTPASVSLGQRLKHEVDGRFHDRLMHASLRTAGIAPLEDQGSLDHLRQASEGLDRGTRTPGDAAAGILALVLRYSRLVGYLALVAWAFTWWAALLTGMVTMAFRYGQRGGVRIYTRRWAEGNAARREADYFRLTGMGAPAAKELRVFGLTDWVKQRYESRVLDALRPIWEERRRVSVHNFFWFTGFGLLVLCVVLSLLLREAATGRVDLTAVVLTLQAVVAATLLGEFYHEADTLTQFGMISARSLTSFERQVDEFAKADGRAASDVVDVPAEGLLRRSVRFDKVTFSYPHGGGAVLDALDLELRAGQCTALVGLNGAGKTTLVKLLARLYDPTEGAVLVDGHDIRDVPVDTWRRQVGVIFQDFNRYQLSALDNIAFGCVERGGDVAAVRDAARGAGILDTLDRLDGGLEAPLARDQDGGVELSGGQWQRVAIARALFAVSGGARLLVLDEPTAALDIRAEAAFFDEFARLTRGVTTLLISHRFSSVRHADRIVVLDGGRVVEDGTHTELLAADGRYAHLFHLQARRFEAGLDPDDDSQDDVIDDPRTAAVARGRR